MFSNPVFRVENLPLIAGGSLVFAIGLSTIFWIGLTAPPTFLAVCVYGGLVFAPLFHALDH